MGNIKSNMTKHKKENFKQKKSLLMDAGMEYSDSSSFSSYKQTFPSKGDMLRQAGEFKQALIEYNEELAINPNNFHVLNNKAIVLESLGAYEEAIETYDLALKINKRFYKAYFNKGNALFDLGLFEKSIEAYDCALKINPNYFEALVNKGVAIEELSHDKIGSHIYDYLIDPNYLKLNPKESLLKHLERSISEMVKNQHTNSNFEVIFAQAELLCFFKQYEAAIEKYNVCLKLKPDNYFTYNSKGLALEKLDLHDLAITAYNKAIKINPNYYQAHFNKANVLFDKELYESAIEEYDLALKIKPNSKEAITNKKFACDALLSIKAHNDDDDFEVS